MRKSLNLHPIPSGSLLDVVSELNSEFLYEVYPYMIPIIGFVTRLKWRVPLVEQELLILPEHLSSHLVLVGFVLLDCQFNVYVL